MRPSVFVIVWILFLPAAGIAWDAVCSGVRQDCAGTTGMSNYIQNVDLEQIPTPACTALPNDHVTVAQQKQLVQTVVRSHENGHCHLKVVAGLAVEMTQAEKDAVNAAMQPAKDEQAAHEAEANDPECSKATQAQIDAFFQKKWDDPAGINDFKGDIDALTTNTAAAIRTTLTNITQRMLGVVKKIAKCNRAMGG